MHLRSGFSPVYVAAEKGRPAVKVQPALEKVRLSFPWLVTGVRLKDKKAIRQFRELLLIEWIPSPRYFEYIRLSDFLRKARRHKKESETARLLNEIVCDCPRSRRNTNDLVLIDDERCERFRGMFSKEFTSLGLVLAGVSSDQTDLQLLATKKFQTVIRDEGCPVAPPFILKYGIVPRFDEFLEREDSTALQTEAALALIDISDTAVLQLGKVAAHRKFHYLVHQHEAVRPLLDELDKNDNLLPNLRKATHTLLRFCKGKERPGEFEVEIAENKYGKFVAYEPVVVVRPHLDKMRTIIPELSRLIDLTDEEILEDACSMLACLTDVSPAMLALGNIVLRKDIQPQQIVDFGALPRLWKLLSKNIEEMVRRRESVQEKDANEDEPEEDTANGVAERSAEKMSELNLSVGEIIREVGVSTVEFTDVVERLGKRSGTDFTPKKMHIRIMFGFQFTKALCI
ncbi:hypothetical protein CQW23_07843 [Capsicum baccatum]|uniref:Uncharacterized protein n=1 Tax=Capsicum baccatum TaxID=33114 RepID=A0A2G2X7S3_CAPBA|nr:hypothetical protein CQW23_07843 [Capsicum baccatum]